MLFGYKHFIRLDAQKNIIKAFSSAFEQPEDGDICVEENGIRQYSLDLWDSFTGCLKLSWDGSKIVSNDLSAAIAAKQAQVAADAAVAVKAARRALGAKVIDTMSLINDSKNITTAQTVAFLADPDIQAIVGLLNVGALDSAKAAITALDLSKPALSVSLSEDDRTKILALLA